MEVKIFKQLLTIMAVGVQWWLIFFQWRVSRLIVAVLDRNGVEGHPALRPLSLNVTDSALVITAAISTILGTIVWYRFGRSLLLLLFPTIINLVFLIVTYGSMLKMFRLMLSQPIGEAGG